MTADREARPTVCRCVASTIGRRALLGVGTSVGIGLVAPASAQSDASRIRPQEGDLLVRADSTDLVPLTPQSLPSDGFPMMAFPYDPAAKLVRNGSRLNKILVQRLEPSGLNEPTAQRAAEGVVAYSAICPHAGCDVSVWVAEQKIFECSCHYSHYDPREGAAVIDGPAPRALAALPLKVADGKLVVAKPFTARVGIVPT